MLVEPTWTGFFFLRVMFDPKRCAKQSWFPKLVEQYPEAAKDAMTGVIPSNYEKIMDGTVAWHPTSPRWETFAYNPTKLKQEAARRARTNKAKKI